MLNLDLSKKVAIVTGGSQGVGRGIVEKLAQAGANIVLVHYDKDDTKVNETLENIRPYGVETLVFKLNVADAVAVSNMMKQVNEHFHHIDILVNNAGIGTVGDLIDLPYDQIDAVLSVNLKGPFVMCKEVLPYMVDQNFGRIINISSTSMHTGGGGGAHYAASKSGLLGMMRNMAKVYGKNNITTNNLAISLIDTEMFRSRYTDPKEREQAVNTVPVKRAGTPDDVGYAVCYLASDWASYVNGEVLQLDGGRLYA